MAQVSSPAVLDLGVSRPLVGSEEGSYKKWLRDNMEQKEYILATIVDHAGSSNTSVASTPSIPSVASAPSSASQSVSVASTPSVASIASGATALTPAMSYTLPPNILSQNGEYVEIEAYGACAATTDVKTADILFGGTTPIATTGSLTCNGTKWHMRARVTREATKVQTAFNYGGMSNDAVIVPALAALTRDETTQQSVIVQLSGAVASAIGVNSLTIKVGKLVTATPTP